MTGQMTIFDFLKPQEVDLEILPEEDMVHMLEDAAGISFKKIVYTNRFYHDFHEYEYKHGQLRITVKYENYCMEERHDRFIDVMYTLKNNSEGAGGPCDTIDEALFFIKRGLKRLEEIKQK